MFRLFVVVDHPRQCCWILMYFKGHVLQSGVQGSKNPFCFHCQIAFQKGVVSIHLLSVQRVSLFLGVCQSGLTPTLCLVDSYQLIHPDRARVWKSERMKEWKSEWMNEWMRAQMRQARAAEWCFCVPVQLLLCPWHCSLGYELASEINVYSCLLGQGKDFCCPYVFPSTGSTLRESTSSILLCMKVSWGCPFRILLFGFVKTKAASSPCVSAASNLVPDSWRLVSGFESAQECRQDLCVHVCERSHWFLPFSHASRLHTGSLLSFLGWRGLGQLLVPPC